MAGATVHAPCVNRSRYLTHIEGTDIFLGFVHLHGLERSLAHRIVQQRAQGGLYRSLADFLSRVACTGEQLEILIRIGAFRFTGKRKYELMWEKGAVQPAVGGRQPAVGGQQSLGFDPPPDQDGLSSALPALEEGPYDQAFDEIELLGFSLCSPFELLKDREACRSKKYVRARALKAHAGRRVQLLGYYVCRKDVRTVRGRLMHFGTWLDQAGHFFDTTHFPDSLKTAPFRGKGIYRITGRVVLDFGFPGVEVEQLELLPLVADSRYSG